VKENGTRKFMLRPRKIDVSGPQNPPGTSKTPLSTLRAALFIAGGCATRFDFLRDFEGLN
jgi:hypothetical protein